MTSYEFILQMIAKIPSAESRNSRDVTWMTSSRVVGVARDDEGRIEVFLVGPKLNPVSSLLRETIQFHAWHREGTQSFEANRILFPALGHFDQVAAFVCTELLRSGADTSLASAFIRTEPIIELAIERLQLSGETMMGLAGELLLLDALCRRASDAQIPAIIGSWDGWKRSSRDFSWGSTGVEVKTTTHSSSSHIVQGIHQVEIANAPDGSNREENVLLVSIGLHPTTDEGNSFTISLLLDRIVRRMEEVDIGISTIEKFFYRVSEYGAGSGGRYVRDESTADPIYSRAFLPTFVRAYDMTDTSIRILRRDDIALRHHTNVDSVRFRVELPNFLSPTNPVVGANQVADFILASRSELND